MDENTTFNKEKERKQIKRKKKHESEFSCLLF